MEALQPFSGFWELRREQGWVPRAGLLKVCAWAPRQVRPHPAVDGNLFYGPYFTSFFFFPPTHSVWSPQARDQFQTTVVTCATALAMLDPLTHSTGLGIDPVSCRDTTDPVAPSFGAKGFEEPFRI